MWHVCHVAVTVTVTVTVAVAVTVIALRLSACIAVPLQSTAILCTRSNTLMYR